MRAIIVPELRPQRVGYRPRSPLAGARFRGNDRGDGYHAGSQVLTAHRDYHPTAGANYWHAKDCLHQATDSHPDCHTDRGSSGCRHLHPPIWCTEPDASRGAPLGRKHCEINCLRRIALVYFLIRRWSVGSLVWSRDGPSFGSNQCSGETAEFAPLWRAVPPVIGDERAIGAGLAMQVAASLLRGRFLCC